jgi:two-component system alkaline phosphatase synthesis response regulator PhoP
MDVMMPRMDGIEACSEIRSREGMESSLICFLTARGEDYSQIAAFEAGGDDYIVKPVKPKVLLHRIKAILKRYYREEKTEADSYPGEKSGLKIDRERYIIIKEGEEIVVPRKEFELLALLMSRQGKVFTREEIYSKVWGDDVIVGERTIDVHIRKLRERIGDGYIQTLKGVGYKFTDGM